MSQIQVEDKLYERIHRDKTSLMIVNAISRRNPVNEEGEDSEAETVLFELAICYGYWPFFLVTCHFSGYSTYHFFLVTCQFFWLFAIFSS